MEMWTGKLVNYSSLYIFKCLTYVMYNDQKEQSWIQNLENIYILGVRWWGKGYCLWDPTVIKVIISKDVIFVEDMLQSEEGDNTCEKRE